MQLKFPTCTKSPRSRQTKFMFGRENNETDCSKGRFRTRTLDHASSIFTRAQCAELSVDGSLRERMNLTGIYWGMHVSTGWAQQKQEHFKKRASNETSALSAPDVFSPSIGHCIDFDRRGADSSKRGCPWMKLNRAANICLMNERRKSN